MSITNKALSTQKQAYITISNVFIDDFLHLSLGHRFEQQLVNAALIALHEATIAHVICQLCYAADKGC